MDNEAILLFVNEFNKTITIEIVFEIILVVLFLFMSALISGSEVAFFSFSPSKLKKLESSKNKLDIAIISLISKPDKLLATILILNNFANICIVTISTFVVNNFFDFSAYPILGFLIQVVLITLIILLFGEILPKVMATYRGDIFVKIMTYPLLFASKILLPINYLLILGTSGIQKVSQKHKRVISMDELSQAMELTSHELKEEKEMLEGVVKISNTEVKEIMISRTDVVLIEYSATLNKVLSIIVESGYSGIPVYQESFDNIKGILHIKDLLPHIEKNADFEWRSILRPAFFVPESKISNDLLKEFLANKIHIAIVVDEYGGSQGIITLEDILEEIVGEINDEFDTEESVYKKIDDKNYLFEAKVHIGDFCKLLHLDDDTFDQVKGEADTIAGLILEHTNEIPIKNSVIKILNFEFTIVSVDNKRIKQIKVSLK